MAVSGVPNDNNVPQYNWLDYAKFCQSLNFIPGAPGIGNILMGMPMPEVQFYFQQQWFGTGGNWGNFDSFMPTGAIRYTQTTGGVSTKNDVDTSGMTAEELLEHNTRKAEEEDKKQTLVDTYNSLYKLLEDYAETLTDTTNPKQSVFKKIIRPYENKAKNSMSEDALKAELEKLKAVYNMYNTDDVITNSVEKSEEWKKVMSLPSNEAKTTAEKLFKQINTAITNNGDADNLELSAVLKENEEWNSDVDILDFMSAWNSDKKINSPHIILKLAQLVSYDVDICGENEASKLATLAEKIEEQLTERTKTALAGLDKNSPAKKAIEAAQEDLKKFPKDKLQRLRCGAQYSNAIDNLYRAIRLAEAEKLDKELNNKFRFLGDQYPYKDKNKITTQLTGENLESARTVYPPETGGNRNSEVADDNNKVAIVRVEGNVYYAKIGENNKIELYNSIGEKLNCKHIKNGYIIIGMHRNGEYKLQHTVGSVTTFQYYDKDGNIIDKGTYDGKDNDSKPAEATGQANGSSSGGGGNSNPVRASNTENKQAEWRNIAHR